MKQFIVKYSFTSNVEATLTLKTTADTGMDAVLLCDPIFHYIVGCSLQRLNDIKICQI